MHKSIISFLALVASAAAHTGAWAPGMYCRGGNNSAVDDQNTNLVVNPLYQLSTQDWWFQHDRGCDQVPPADGEFLELPAGGSFTIELAHNRAQTTLSYNGQFTSEWPDGKDHPENWNGTLADPGEGCIQEDGAMHVQNQTSATGTAFAISYESDITKVTIENLAVFTVLEHTPWHRIATYEVPDLPACPPGGCHCAWLWVPKGCGIPNMYMQGFKCNVTGATSTATVAPAQPPTYCQGDASTCVKGAKQMIAWHQAEGNNVVAPNGVSPGYNAAWGYLPGAQQDILVAGAAKASSSAASSSAAASITSSTSSLVASSSSTPLSPIVKAASTTSSFSSTTTTTISSSSFSAASYSSTSTSSSPSSYATFSASYSSVLYPNVTSSLQVKAILTSTTPTYPYLSTPVQSAETSSSSSITPSYSSSSAQFTPVKPVKPISVSSYYSPAPTTLSTKVLPILTSTYLSVPSAAPTGTPDTDDFASLKAYIDRAFGKWFKKHGYKAVQS